MEKDMAQRIKDLRSEKGMTLEQVASVVGVGKSTVRKWETGMIANMKRDKIASLALALGTTPEYLMGWEKENNTPNNQRDVNDDEYSIILKYRTLDEYGQQNVNAILNNEYARCQDAKVISLKEDKSPYSIHTLAAHEKAGASEEDKQRDYDLMNDPSIWGDKT